MKTSAVIMFVLGCGGSSEHPPDAPAVDASPDASPDAPEDALACTPTAGTSPVLVDGPSGSATLQVTFIVQDATGALVSRSTMGADASASIPVPSCGMVTIVDTDPASSNGKDVVTWAGVQPGDHLVHPGRRPTDIAKPLSVQLAALAGATKYQLIAKCHPNGLEVVFNPSPGAVAMNPSCPPT